MQHKILKKYTLFLIAVVFSVMPAAAQNCLDFVPIWVRVGDRTAAIDKERDTASIESAEFSRDGDVRL